MSARLAKAHTLRVVRSASTLVILYITLLLLVLSGAAATQVPLTPTEMPDYKVILYHTNWANYGRNFQVKDIPIRAVTDIAYAFFNLASPDNGETWQIVSGDTYRRPGWG